MPQDRHEQAWTHWGTADPFWAVLADPAKAGGKWDMDEFLASGGADVEEVFAALSAMGAAPKGSHALDFGCGPGRLTQALARRFGHVTGVDISSSMLALARRHNQHGDRVRYVHSTDARMEWLEAGSIDFALSLMTFQHIPLRRQRRYLASLVKALRPGGVLAFQVPEARLRPTGPEGIGQRIVRWGYNWAPGTFPKPLYWFERRRQPNPIEMHVFPRRQAAKVAGRGGARLVASIPDTRAGPWFTSHLHVVVKG